MAVRDPLALALCLGLLAGPVGALATRRGASVRGALLGAAAAAGAALLADGALAAGLGADGAGLAAAVGALCALLLPGPAAGRRFGRAFGLGDFAGTIAEARLPASLAGATPSRLVDPADALRVERAILGAEAKADAELAVTLVRRCGAYGAAAWRAGAWLAALALTGAAALGPPEPRAGLAAAAAGLALGLAAARAARVQRLIVSEAALAQRAEARALDAFARAGLGRTPGHAGILVFAALLEGRVVVLAGRGLREAARAFEGVAVAAAEGFAADAPDGLLRALERAGAAAAALRPRREPAAADGRPPPVFVED